MAPPARRTQAERVAASDTRMRRHGRPPLASRVFYVLMHESIGPAPQIREHFVRFGKRWQASLTHALRQRMSPTH